MSVIHSYSTSSCQCRLDSISLFVYIMSTRFRPSLIENDGDGRKLIPTQVCCRLRNASSVIPCVISSPSRVQDATGLAFGQPTEARQPQIEYSGHSPVNQCSIKLALSKEINVPGHTSQIEELTTVSKGTVKEVLNGKCLLNH